LHNLCQAQQQQPVEGGAAGKVGVTGESRWMGEVGGGGGGYTSARLHGHK